MAYYKVEYNSDLYPKWRIREGILHIRPVDQKTGLTKNQKRAQHVLFKSVTPTCNACPSFYRHLMAWIQHKTSSS